MALDALAEGHLDLVILDLGRPGVHGLDLLGALRERGDLTPMLVLSGRDDDLGEVHTFDSGADDYVTSHSA